MNFQILSVKKKNYHLKIKKNLNFYIESIKKNALSVEDSILRMKQVLQVEKVAKKISLSTIWEEAREHLAWRVSELNINISQTFEKGANYEMYYIADVVRHIFHNLLLNSLDSFEKSAKSNRNINLAVYPPNLKNHSITFSYSDSGKGLDKDKLNRLLINFNENKTKKIEIEELIFRDQITTKETGSG
jgi:signal transduction histidine kinase